MSADDSDETKARFRAAELGIMNYLTDNLPFDCEVQLLPRKSSVANSVNYYLAPREAVPEGALKRKDEDSGKAASSGSPVSAAVAKRRAEDEKKARNKRLRTRQIALSLLFKKMEALRMTRTLPIQEWSVSKTTLDDVFLGIVEKYSGVLGPGSVRTDDVNAGLTKEANTPAFDTD